MDAVTKNAPGRKEHFAEYETAYIKIVDQIIT